MGFLRSDKKPTTHVSTSPCANLRAAYDKCFNRWYSEKFLKGVWDKEECVSEWNKYRDCLSQHLDDKHLARFLEAEGIGNMINQVNASSPKGAPT
ncbi:uncharacterized protein At4g33100 [Apium graveolens]|uniref:uncharacterized protein At4g33100 n=1 Tax=Apium graveolens TaxID=4045 RepID=UPI003D7A3A84